MGLALVEFCVFWGSTSLSSACLRVRKSLCARLRFFACVFSCTFSRTHWHAPFWLYSAFRLPALLLLFPLLLSFSLWIDSIFLLLVVHDVLQLWSVSYVLLFTLWVVSSFFPPWGFVILPLQSYFWSLWPRKETQVFFFSQVPDRGIYWNQVKQTWKKRVAKINPNPLQQYAWIVCFHFRHGGECCSVIFFFVFFFVHPWTTDADYY